MSDKVYIGLGFNENIRVYGTTTLDILNYIGDKFGYLPSSLDAVGRCLSIGAMMACSLKGDETLTLRIEGDGPIGKIIIDGDSYGHLRAFATNPQTHFENNNGTLNVSKTIGNKGNIIVIKDLKLKEPYTCYSPIINGEVATDFAYYFSVSEQIPTAISLGVLVGEDSRAISSGGFLVQALPNTKEEILIELEENIKKLPPMSELLHSGYSIIDILKNICPDFKLLEEKDLSFKCNCSKDKFARGILSLGSDEILDMMNKEKEINCTCNFCLNEYHFSLDELNELYLEAKKKGK